MSKSDPGLRRVAPTVWRYGLSVLSVAISTAVSFPMREAGVRTSLFFPAVLLSTWLGGTGPGLLAVVLSILSINFFFSEPLFAFQFTVRDIPHTVAFLFSALVISSWSAARKRAENRLRESEQELRKSRDELESRVQERTADLSRSNEALRTSEEKYRDLINASPDAICVVDEGGKCLLVNPAAVELIGRSEDELIGSTITDTYLPEERHLLAERLEKLKVEGSFRFERKFVRKNGEIIPAEVSLSTLRDGHYQAIIRDISQRKRREALLAGEKRLLEMVAKGDSLPLILDALCRLVEELASGAVSSILLLDGNCLRHGAAPSLPQAYTDAIDGLAIGPATGSCGTAAYRAQPVIVSDIATDPLWADYRDVALPHGLRACWSTPILSSESKVLGTFAIYYREPRNPTPELHEIIEQITHLASIALERKQAEGALRASEQVARGQVEALAQNLDILATTPAPESLIGQMLSTIGRFMNAQSVVMWLLDDATGSLVLRAAAEGENFMATDPEHPFIKDPKSWKNAPWLREIFFTGVPAVVEDLDTDPRVAPATREYFRSKGTRKLLEIPTLVGGDVKGFIGIRHGDRPSYRPEEIELAQALSHQAMFAIQFNQFAAQGQQAAVLEERNRMARDIHDTLAQGFTGVIVQLEAAEDAIADGQQKEADKHLHRAAGLARQSLSEARRSVHALRPDVLRRADLWEALKGIIKRTTAGTPLHTTFERRGKLPELPPLWQENLLHIGQEALSNTLKYAEAKNFRARLRCQAGEVRLELQDDGAGFELKDRHDGLGLTGMRERVEQMNGELEITSARGQGTNILVALSL